MFSWQESKIKTSPAFRNGIGLFKRIVRKTNKVVADNFILFSALMAQL